MVTADGELRVANAVSNPDLFWALKGGGGGTFGIVTEATVKAFPSPKMVISLFYVNTTDINDRKSIFAPLAHLHTTLPSIVDSGVSGFYFAFPNAIKVFLLTITNSTRLPTSVINPIAKKMASFPGIRRETSSQILHWRFASYQAFFDASFGHGDQKEAQKKSGIMARELQELRKHATLLRRHGPGSGEMEAAETQALGILPIDSILMDKDIITHPKLAEALQASMPKGERAQLRGNLVSGRVVHQLGNDTSVNPAWRRAYCHLIATASGRESIGDPDVTPLKALKKDYGVYLNEVSERWLPFVLTVQGVREPNELEVCLLGTALRKSVCNQNQVRPIRAVLGFSRGQCRPVSCSKRSGMSRFIESRRWTDKPR